jgi:hypothetical protein
MSNELDNLTESVQRLLGLQQAQTFSPEDITADAMGRLLATRGDVSRLQRIWDPAAEAGPNLVAGWDDGEHRPVLHALRRVLDASMVVQRRNDGRPKSFLPFAPEFVGAERVSTIYRDLGRSVVEGLWGRPGQEELRTEVKHRLETWGGRHPLGLLLAPLCPTKEPPEDGAPSLLKEVIAADAQLRVWVDNVVTEDWNAWLRASESLSVDEQIETMTGLIGLHLHTCLMRRLGRGRDQSVPACYFVAVDASGVDPACARAAYNCFGFWRERAGSALQFAAEQAIEKLGGQEPEFRRALDEGTWQAARYWATAKIQGGRRAARATEEFRQSFQNSIDERASETAPAKEDVLELAVAALVNAFDTPSGVAAKVKDHLRGYGRAAGIVGPEGRGSRKRYQLDERAIGLLARLHAHRDPDRVRSFDDEIRSVDALLDDIFDRYGMVITRERESVNTRLGQDRGALAPLLRHFPAEQPMRDNRARLDRRLDELRLVRRYSDASAVIYIP